jgi:hypothetical protein
MPVLECDMCTVVNECDSSKRSKTVKNIALQKR